MVKQWKRRSYSLARQPVDGWTTWGNEVSHDFTTTAG